MKTMILIPTAFLLLCSCANKPVARAGTPEKEQANPYSVWTEWGFADFGSGYPATPGTRLDFIKVGEGTSHEGKPGVKFIILPVGVPADRVYYLCQGNGQEAPTRIPDEMIIGDDGYLVPQGKSKPMSLLLHSFARGEAQVYALMTADKSLIAYGKIIPYPIEARQGARRIWVELITETSFEIYGEGFDPGEELEITCSSDSHVMKDTKTVEADGRFIEFLSPELRGQESGQTTYTVVGPAGTLSVLFEWGPPALRAGP